MRQDERVDLMKEKDQLTQALGNQAPRYWEIFRDFIQARLSKPEFDIAAKRVLSEHNLALHNQFVHSILQNARSSRPPPEFTKQMLPKIGDKRKKRRTLEPTPHKKRRLNATETEAYSVIRRKSLSGIIRIQHFANNEDPARAHGAQTMSLLDEQLVTDPEKLVLRQKMKQAAADASVSEVSNDSVSCMMQAVQIQLKRAIQLCIAEKKGAGRDVSKQDLWQAVANNPAFFKNAASSMDQERALLLLD